MCVEWACVKSICVSSALEAMWSIMASFMLYVVDKYARDLYMENANLFAGWSLSALKHIDRSAF